jgi:hypothetical protein
MDQKAFFEEYRRTIPVDGWFTERMEIFRVVHQLSLLLDCFEDCRDFVPYQASPFATGEKERSFFDRLLNARAEKEILILEDSVKSLTKRR